MRGDSTCREDSEEQGEGLCSKAALVLAAGGRQGGRKGERRANRVSQRGGAGPQEQGSRTLTSFGLCPS